MPHVLLIFWIWLRNDKNRSGYYGLTHKHPIQYILIVVNKNFLSLSYYLPTWQLGTQLVKLIQLKLIFHLFYQPGGQNGHVFPPTASDCALKNGGSFVQIPCQDSSLLFVLYLLHSLALSELASCCPHTEVFQVFVTPVMDTFSILYFQSTEDPVSLCALMQILS